VNSFTSNSEKHRRYVYGVVLLALFPALILFLLGIYLQPLYGDLTRIGSYSEREFGWSEPQVKFTKPLYTDGYYQSYHDVLVFGDSFSRAWPQHQWQNYLVSATDFSVATLNINTVKLEDILGSKVFREAPPKVFIYESVERSFLLRMASVEACEQADSSLKTGQSNAPQFVRAENLRGAQTVEREKKWSDVKLAFVLKYLWNSSLRSASKVERTEARKLALVQDVPFSSANKREILVYKDDFEKVASWRGLGDQDLDCRIEGIRQRVEANGKTKFVLMVAPDKLTAYSDFVEDGNVRNISKLHQLLDRNGAIMPRLDLALSSAIRKGEKDVYLPDDTHWGAKGHRIAAEALMDFLQNHD